MEKVTGIRFPAELQSRLDAKAVELDRSVSWVVRAAVERYLAGTPVPPKPVRAPEQRHVRDQTPPVAESREARQERARKVMAAAEGSKPFYRETVEPIAKKGK